MAWTTPKTDFSDGDVLTAAEMNAVGNDLVWLHDNGGDITNVIAGTGISGGGTSGDVTITNSMATTIDAKGDLIAGTGADAFARVAVGANDLLLMAASGEATGLKWGGTWQTWTPSFTNFTLGNGTLNAARYCQIGKIVFVNISVTLGSTSSVSGPIAWSGPVSAASVPQCSQLNAWILDYGNDFYYGYVNVKANGGGTLYVANVSATYLRETNVSATVPMTWTTNDQFEARYWYEAA